MSVAPCRRDVRRRARNDHRRSAPAVSPAPRHGESRVSARRMSDSCTVGGAPDRRCPGSGRSARYGSARYGVGAPRGRRATGSARHGVGAPRGRRATGSARYGGRRATGSAQPRPARRALAARSARPPRAAWTWAGPRGRRGQRGGAVGTARLRRPRRRLAGSAGSARRTAGLRGGRSGPRGPPSWGGQADSPAEWAACGQAAPSQTPPPPRRVARALRGARPVCEAVAARPWRPTVNGRRVVSSAEWALVGERRGVRRWWARPTGCAAQVGKPRLRRPRRRLAGSAGSARCTADLRGGRSGPRGPPSWAAR